MRSDYNPFADPFAEDENGHVTIASGMWSYMAMLEAHMGCMYPSAVVEALSDEIARVEALGYELHPDTSPVVEENPRQCPIYGGDCAYCSGYRGCEDIDDVADEFPMGETFTSDAYIRATGDLSHVC